MNYKCFVGMALLAFPLCFVQAEEQRQFSQKKVNANQNIHSLTVSVTKLRNAKGLVQFSLYNKKGTIPDQHYKYFIRQLKGKIVNGRSRVTFENLPEGRYAVNILHDENSNGKIDKGFLLPLEGVGFSNYQSIGLRNRPNFSKASFDLKSNTIKTIKVIYF